MTLKEMRHTRRAGVLNVKSRTFKSEGKGMTISCIMNRCLVFERGESKYCAVLMKHGRKVKGEQVIFFQIDQQLLETH